MELDSVVTLVTSVMREVLKFIESEADFSAITGYKDRDVTRRLDLVAEKKLLDELVSRHFSARVVSEEYGDRIIGDDPNGTFVFDPVDGSTNAAIGFPYFCSSLAFAPKVDDVALSDVTAGVVVTNSLRVYAAKKGRGAFLGEAPLVPRKAPRYKPVIAGYTYGVPTISLGLLELEKFSTVRVFGSIAYDICQVAAGTLDVVIDTRDRLSGYDVAAALLILNESNGIVTALNGTRFDTSVTASNISIVCSAERALHEKIVNTLQEHPGSI